MVSSTRRHISVMFYFTPHLACSIRLYTIGGFGRSDAEQSAMAVLSNDTLMVALACLLVVGVWLRRFCFSGESIFAQFAHQTRLSCPLPLLLPFNLDLALTLALVSHVSYGEIPSSCYKTSSFIQLRHHVLDLDLDLDLSAQMKHAETLSESQSSARYPLARLRSLVFLLHRYSHVDLQQHHRKLF